MKTHEFYKGQVVESSCDLVATAGKYLAGTKFKVIDVIVRHRGVGVMKGELFPGRVQLKLYEQGVDIFQQKLGVPLNCIETKANEDFPFKPSIRLDNKPKP